MSVSNFKCPVLQENNQPRFAAQDLTPFLQSLLENLFVVFTLPDSAENEYAMKCVMRVVSFVGPQVLYQPSNMPISFVAIQI